MNGSKVKFIPSKSRKGLSVKAKRTIFIWAMLAYPIIQFLVFFVYVNIDSVLMSLQRLKPDKFTGELQSTFPTLYYYEKFFKDVFVRKNEDIVNAIKNSLLVGLNDLILVVLSVTLSYFFYKKMPGRGVFRIIYFLPSIISIVVYTMVYKYMFDNTFGPVSLLLQKIFGWTASTAPKWWYDHGIGMIMLYCLWVGTGYNILILGGAIANIPEEVMESARMDGVKMRHELFLFVIPLIWPTISVSILGAATTMFTLFVQVDLLTGRYAPTIAYRINSIIQGGKPNELSEASAIGLIFTVIAMPIIIIVKKLLDKASDAFGF